jgi:hypothetical protein
VTDTTTPAVAQTADVETPALPNFKYQEGTILADIQKYIVGTYSGHYVGEDNSVQSIDAIMAAGHGLGFTVGNVIKYGMRLGKKGGWNEDDILKIIHYAVLTLHQVRSKGLASVKTTVATDIDAVVAAVKSGKIDAGNLFAKLEAAFLKAETAVVQDIKTVGGQVIMSSEDLLDMIAARANTLISTGEDRLHGVVQEVEKTLSEGVSAINAKLKDAEQTVVAAAEKVVSPFYSPSSN